MMYHPSLKYCGYGMDDVKAAMDLYGLETNLKKNLSQVREGMFTQHGKLQLVITDHMHDVFQEAIRCAEADGILYY